METYLLGGLLTALSGVGIILIVIISMVAAFRVLPFPSRVRDTAQHHPIGITYGGILVGAIYGIAFRYVAQPGNQLYEPEFEIMGVRFIIVVPLIIGFLTVFLGIQSENWSLRARLLVPWHAAALTLGTVFLLAWEGLICIILFLPLMLLLASVGGVLGGWTRDLYSRWSGPKIASVSVAAMLLPFLLPDGGVYLRQEELRLVRSEIEIAATPEDVWEEIRSVPAIQEEEHSLTLSHLIGFPRPIAAELRGEGIGAERLASFEGEVVFYEKVNRWEPPFHLAFTVEIDPESIPPTSLDPHVTIGGRYFDVLDGAYEVVPLASGHVRLVLQSQHRLATEFNFYSRIWTDFIMQDLQSAILKVIKARAEHRMLENEGHA